MSEEPIEVEKVEYMDAEPAAPQHQQARTVIYQSEGLPCCSGCGCLLLLLLVLNLFSAGSLFTGIIIFIAALWVSTAALRFVGVRRWSQTYVYVLVPLFLIMVNVLTAFFKDYYPYTTLQIVGGTLAIYVFLFLARGLGRP